MLNSGLDAACTYPASGSIDYPSFCRFIRYAAIGTGSTVPEASQTTLDAQVGSRSTDRGGFANSEDAGLDDTNDVIWYEGTFTRVFNIASSVNAAEWGLSEGSTGNLSVRELFRADPNDNQSTPITLTLETGDQLQLVITFRVQATWEYESKSFVITGTTGNDAAGTHAGNATVSSGSLTGTSDVRQAITYCWPGEGGTVMAYLTSQAGAAKNQELGGSSVYTASVLQAYVAGTYYREAVVEFGTSLANGDHYAWRIGAYNKSDGLRFILTNPASLTKTSTHRLTLTIRKSITRL